MQYLDLTLPTAAENLALDEALLDEAEAAAAPLETLRLWELQSPAAIIGRSSRVAAEVQVDACRQLGVPILRRISGGAAILAGPGCLMYSLVLSYELRPALRLLSEAHREVLDTVAVALSPLVRISLRTEEVAVRVPLLRRSSERANPQADTACEQAVAHRSEQCGLSPGIRRRGTSDLTLDVNEQLALKFSGNSVRCRRDHLLYHGTLLYDFPLALVERCLTMPPRMPDYREGRPHGAFVANLPANVSDMRQSLRAAWKADAARTDWPCAQVERLVQEKYSRKEWNEPTGG